MVLFGLMILSYQSKFATNLSKVHTGKEIDIHEVIHDNTTMKFWRRLLLVSLLLFITNPSLTFAGGGPLGIDESFPLAPFEQTKAFVVGVSIYEPECDTIDVKATLENKTDGDSITVYTPPSDGTFLERHYFTGSPQNTWTKICKRYFKVTSATQKQRTFIAEAMVNGEKAKVTYPVSFGDDEYSRQLQTMERFMSTPQIDIISEKSLGGNKREVKVQWNKVPGVEKYAVFARELVDNGQQIEVGPFLSPLDKTEGTKATLNLASDLDFNLSAVACETDACTPYEPYEVLLSRLQGGNTSSPETLSKPLPLVSPTANPQEDKMEKLNKKIAELEGKLEKSEKKQSLLEEKINQLLSFIRSLFPNFQ